MQSACEQGDDHGVARPNKGDPPNLKRGRLRESLLHVIV